MSQVTRPVVTFGEVLLRLSPPLQERLFQSPTMRTFWGGAEANVAAGLANLGTASQHVTVLPHGAIGDAAASALRADGVDTTHVLRRGDRMGLYFVEPGADVRPLRVVYDRADSAFAAQQGDEFEWSMILGNARWLHVTGISAALGDGPLRNLHAAIDVAATLGVSISLDLNFRPALWVGRDPKPIMQALAARASLLIANPGAIDAMLGIRTAGTAPETAAAVHATVDALHATYGATQIAITQREVISASRHAWQAYLWEASTGVLSHGGRHTVTVVDRAGGGDAFTAGLLHALLAGAPAHDAVRFATAAGALKMTIPGDINRVSAGDVQSLLDTVA
ncbi:MAG: sugar kinase [Gemmatimonadaceae bacterium]|nr:sugar kinase [Gemmatimonadaceae bacterium]